MTGSAEKSELSQKLNKLFDTMRNPGKPALSNAAAAEEITQKTGVSISPAYIWQLRKGIKTNPTVEHLQAIAKFFGVPAAYLLDDGVDDAIDAQLTLLRSMRDSGIRDLAMRANGLTPQALMSLAAMIDHARALEQLPPVAPLKEGDGLDESV